MSQQRKFVKQWYYRNLHTLRLCRPDLLSGNIQSGHVAAEERFQTMILSEHNIVSLCMPALLSGNFQSEHVAAGESVQTKILSEH